MNGVALAPWLVFATLGLALSFARSRRVLAWGLGSIVAAALAGGSAAIDPAFLETALRGCWIGMAVAAAWVLARPSLALLPAVVLGLNGGAWAGLAVAAVGQASDLLVALPSVLLCLPGAVLVAHGRGVVVKVLLSWLAAAAILSAGLTLTPTLGYEPDHLE